MIKIKNILIAAIASILIYACSASNPFVDNFDHEAQALKDKDTLVKYLSNHYYDAVIDSIKPITTGKTALIDDAKLITQDITFEEIDYKMYYYIVEQGVPDPVKGFPTVMDSVLTKYQGRQIIDSGVASVFETQSSAVWLTLDAVIKGWSYGFTHFKGGKNSTTNGPITYENTGKGFLFIPSGLAYRNLDGGNILPNSCLVFRIELLDIVENTDHDNDGLASYLEIEDASVESDPTKVDTDGDFIANFKDADDDNDGTPTIKEDANKDGDPRNDFSDPSNPTLPDYLNPKIK
ncbi:FKBP-type peptidyl-prolyl cis-trans isomerase [Polaribacter uvawellassae]|uniref:FKBP-type peptidyl-prolyl cis-trans isomerase n=1 Tax=Polaribacter uvawellassae TaxID=3133495 RepID=UPI0032198B1D